MTLALWLLGGVAAFGYGTLWLGWWAVPLLALAMGLAVPGRLKPTLLISAAAVVGWGVLLVRAARAPAFGTLQDRLAALLPVSPVALIGVTLLFPALLALGPALIARVARRGAGGRRPIAAAPRLEPRRY